MSHGAPGPCDTGIASGSSRSGGPARHPRATLAATVLGSSLAFVDGSVVNVALPALERDFGAGPAGLAWIINAYLLPLGALILLGGAAGDRYGRRRLFLAGTLLFLVASVACALAPTLAWFLVARAAQGVGAALLMPNSLALLGAAFEGAARGRAIGTWAAAGAIAGALGPLLGGWLVDVAGWRTIFLLNLPIGAAAAWLALGYVDESNDPAGRRGGLDVAGALLATTGLGLVTWSLSAAADVRGWVPAVAAAGALGLVALGAFVVVESRAGARALMPLALFAGRAAIGLTVFTFLLYAALGGLFVLVPFLLMQVAGWSAIAAGAALMPLPLVIGLGSRAIGAIAARVGGRRPLAAGAATVAAGFALFLRVGPGSIDYVGEVLPATLVVALGMALCVAPLTSTVMASVDTAHVGVASGFNSAVARIGGLIATALLGFVFVEARSPVAFLAGFHVAAIVGAVLAGVSAATVLLLVPGGPQVKGAGSA